MDTHESNLDRAEQRESAGPRSFGPRDNGIRWTVKDGLRPRTFYAALVIVLSAWILHSFVQALLAACVTAIASWPLYRRFTARLPSAVGRSARAVMFTVVMTLFVLAPLIFAIGAMLVEAHALLLQIAAADQDGIAAPTWLQHLPLAGPWLADSWQLKLGHPGALALWAQHIGPGAFLAHAQSLGQFMARHLLIIVFTILVLFFLYHEGESLARGLRRALRHWVGEQADAYVQLATGAVRASVNSMLVVALFDGLFTWAVYAAIGAPHAALWAAITGTLSLVPFLGYLAVIALVAEMAVAGAALPALLSFALGCFILLCGDKIVRPAVAHKGTRLPFVWVLMGCLGGFEVLGLVGLVIGPVLLTLTRELWEQRIRDLARAEPKDSSLPFERAK